MQIVTPGAAGMTDGDGHAIGRALSVAANTMSGTTRTSSDLDPRRRRLLYRAWHRGMREMDLVFGRFCDAEVDRLSEAELDEIEGLMELPDQDVYRWISDPTATPPDRATPLLDRLRVSCAPEAGRR